MALVPLLAAASYSPYLAGMAAGFVIGTFGHVVRSTALIVLGIMIIGGTSVLLMTAVTVS